MICLTKIKPVVTKNELEYGWGRGLQTAYNILGHFKSPGEINIYYDGASIITRKANYKTISEDKKISQHIVYS